nr:HTH domain-containing protein [uncultured Marinifilum sp.]
MVKALNVVERLIKMDSLIKKEKTGNSYQFARQLGISRSQFYNDIDELEDLGIKIRYNKYKLSYEYFGDYVLEIHQPLKIIRKTEELKNTCGGIFCNSPSLLDCFQLTLK